MSTENYTTSISFQNENIGQNNSMHFLGPNYDILNGNLLEPQNYMSYGYVVQNILGKTTAIIGKRQTGKTLLSAYIYGLIQDAFECSYYMGGFSEYFTDKMKKLDVEPNDQFFTGFKQYCCSNQMVNKRVFLLIDSEIASKINKNETFLELMNTNNLTMIINLSYPYKLDKYNQTPYNVILFNEQNYSNVQRIKSFFFPMNVTQSLTNILSSLSEYEFMAISSNNKFNMFNKISMNDMIEIRAKRAAHDFEIIYNTNKLENNKKLIDNKLCEIEKLMSEIKDLL